MNEDAVKIATEVEGVVCSKASQTNTLSLPRCYLYDKLGHINSEFGPQRRKWQISGFLGYVISKLSSF